MVETGQDVEGLQVDQTVLLPAGSGTWTTHLIAEAKRLIPLPNQADPKQLAINVIKLSAKPGCHAGSIFLQTGVHTNLQRDSA